MARTVDFLPFAVNVGANVEGQSSYVIEPIRLTGHQAGVAKSAVVNKSLRQHSVMTAALANMLSEALDVDVLDDGDVEALKQMLQDVLMGGRSTILTADITLYVRTTGSDLNDGLTPTTAFATPQAAIDYAYNVLQLNGHALIIDIGSGTFGSVGVTSPLVGQRSEWHLQVTGAGKGSTTLSSQWGNFSLYSQARAVLSNLRMTSMGGTNWGDGLGIVMHGGCYMRGFDLDFGPMQTGGYAFGNHIHAAYGSIAEFGYIDQDYFLTISGGGNSHILCSVNAMVQFWNTRITLTGTPNFAANFCSVGSNSMVGYNIVPPGTVATTYSGLATGNRFSVDGVSRIITVYRDGDPVFFPGSAAGYWVNGNLAQNYM